MIWREEQGTFGGKALLVFTILFCSIPFCAVQKFIRSSYYFYNTIKMDLNEKTNIGKHF